MEFRGIPDEDFFLRVWWDLDNHFEQISTIEVTDDDLRRNGDKLDLEKTVEHTYHGLSEAVGRKVKVELTLEGRTGHCVRVRTIKVEPPEPPPTLPCGDGVCTVFVTSTLHNADFGGLAGGDAICASRALAAGLSGSFRAWLSTSYGSPASRFKYASVPYVLVDGTRIADDWDDLIVGNLAHPINITETGGFQPRGLVWTGTWPDGTAAAQTCSDWTDSGPSDVLLGRPQHFINPLWTAAGVFTRLCLDSLPLYCFEQ
jgi:hypothetical protein